MTFQSLGGNDKRQTIQQFEIINLLSFVRRAATRGTMARCFIRAGDESLFMQFLRYNSFPMGGMIQARHRQLMSRLHLSN